MGKQMVAFEAKSAKVHVNSALERKALKDEIKANAAEVSRMLKDAVSTDARAQASLRQETAKAIKKTNTRLDAYSNQMKKIAKQTRAQIKATTAKTMLAIKTEQKRARAAVEKFSSADAARQKSALDFLAEQMEIAQKESDAKFGKAQEK